MTKRHNKPYHQQTFNTMDILVTAIITGVCVALGSVLYMKYGKKKVAGGHNETHPPKIIDTLTAALKSLSCEYEVNEKETSIFFIFQDEHFIAYNLNDDSPFITIADTWWHLAPLDDIENLALLRRAVNECNFSSAATLLYTINTEDRAVVLHSKITIPWMPQILDNKKYLLSILKALLRCHHLFFDKMEELRRLDYKQRKKQ